MQLHQPDVLEVTADVLEVRAKRNTRSLTYRDIYGDGFPYPLPPQSFHDYNYKVYTSQEYHDMTQGDRVMPPPEAFNDDSSHGSTG